jgi:hypothetical protein
VVDHFVAFPVLVFLCAKYRNVRGADPVIFSTVPLGREPWPLAIVSVS